VYTLTPIGILPNAGSVLGREQGCFNLACERVAREQEGATREQERATREQEGASREEPVLVLWNSVIIAQCFRYVFS
jgi:hypothetical protein